MSKATEPYGPTNESVSPSGSAFPEMYGFCWKQASRQGEIH